MASQWRPTLTRLQIESLNYTVDYSAENALHVLVPLDVDKHNKRRSVEGIVMDMDDEDVDVFEHKLEETEFKVVDINEMYSIYDDCVSKKQFNDENALFNRVTQCHVSFQQFAKLNKVIKLREKAIFGMFIANLAVFNTYNPLYIGDWLDIDHPFLSMGQAMFANEAFACRISTFGHGFFADQERYKLTIHAAVTEYEAFENLDADDHGDFTDMEFKFYAQMSELKMDSDDAYFRDTTVRELFLRYSPYILGKYRKTRYTNIVSAEIQDWLFQLIRGNCRVIKHFIGSREAHFKRKVFDIRPGVTRELFRNCMKLLGIVDLNVCQVSYYQCMAKVFNRILWGKYVNGVQLIAIQGFNVPFAENGNNEYYWGLARALTKVGRSLLPFFMYVLRLFAFLILCFFFFVCDF